MPNIKTYQIIDGKFPVKKFDVFICCSGYESRATNVAETMNGFDFEKKITFNFNDNKNEIRDKNDQYFKSKKFIEFNVDGNSFREIRDAIIQIFRNKDIEHKRILNVLVDYSCMTRIMYGEIITYFKTNITKEQIVNIFFAYSKAIYTPPSDEQIYNSHVEPIIGFSELTIPERPTALIIGLGYEKNRAYSLKEYLDADKVFLFLSKTISEPKYDESVIKENVELIEKTGLANIFSYPLDDLIYSELVLENLVESLLMEYRIVLAPCGPKPFALLSFIVASKYNDVDVWRVSAGNSAPPQDKRASGEILVFAVRIGS